VKGAEHVAAAEPLTDAEASALRHALGLPDVAESLAEAAGRSYRNHYCAGPGDALMLGLERRGLVKSYGPKEALGGDELFRVTDEGKVEALRSVRVDPMAAGRARYRRFLTMRDVDPDLTFGDYLRAGELK